MSANYITDINGVAQLAQSLPSYGAGTPVSPSGQMCGLSGTQIGQSIFMGNANGACNVLIAGQSVNTSGPLILQVQCSDTDVSGNYTDPTSGLAQFPSVFASGGLLYLGSGGGGIWNASNSGQNVQSGFLAAAYFQRTGVFARINFLAGQYVGPLTAGFISQERTTGSGGGYTNAPQANVPVNV